MQYSMSGKIVWHKEQSTGEERRLYGLPHVKHNKVLSDIFEYYQDRLDRVKEKQSK